MSTGGAKFDIYLLLGQELLLSQAHERRMDSADLELVTQSQPPFYQDSMQIQHHSPIKMGLGIAQRIVVRKGWMHPCCPLHCQPQKAGPCEGYKLAKHSN